MWISLLVDPPPPGVVAVFVARDQDDIHSFLEPSIFFPFRASPFPSARIFILQVVLFSMTLKQSQKNK